MTFANSPSSSRKSMRLDQIKVLIVDDNRHMRVLVKELMHAMGFKIIEDAPDGIDAFEVLRGFPAELIICDWAMPTLDGIEFLRLLRTAPDSPNRNACFIMLTGHTEHEHILEAKAAGVDGFLAKPISAKSLYEHVTGALVAKHKQSLMDVSS